MAIASTTLKTGNKFLLLYEVVTDAAGDGTSTRTNANLLTDLPPGPLEAIFNRTYASQAAARDTILSAVAVLAGVYGGSVPHICPMAGNSQWLVDVALDGSSLPTLQFIAVADAAPAASTVIIGVEYKHTV